jgi:hypothetical protein
LPCYACRPLKTNRHGLDLCGIPRLCSVKPTTYNLQLQFILPTGSFSKPYNTNLQFTSPTGLVLCGIPCPSVVNPTLHPTINFQFTKIYFTYWTWLVWYSLSQTLVPIPYLCTNLQLFTYLLDWLELCNILISVGSKLCSKTYDTTYQTCYFLKK